MTPIAVSLEIADFGDFTLRFIRDTAPGESTRVYVRITHLDGTSETESFDWHPEYNNAYYVGFSPSDIGYGDLVTLTANPRYNITPLYAAVQF